MKVPWNNIWSNVKVPWNNTWSVFGGQKLVRLLVRGWYLWVGSSSTNTNKACGAQALPVLHVCHKTDIASLMCLLVSMNHP